MDAGLDSDFGCNFDECKWTLSEKESIFTLSTNYDNDANSSLINLTLGIYFLTFLPFIRIMIQMTFTEQHLCNDITWHCPERCVWHDILFKSKQKNANEKEKRKRTVLITIIHMIRWLLAYYLLKRSAKTKAQGIKTCVSHYRNWSAKADAK